MARMLSALVLALILVPCYAQDAEVQGPSHYPLKVGTTWVFQMGQFDITSQITGHEKMDGVAVARLESWASPQKKETEYLQVTKDGVYRFYADGVKINPPILLLKLPAKAGERWVVDSKSRDITIKGTFTTHEEEIEVPAGKFKTIRVQSDDYNMNGQPIPVRYWYTEGKGMVKQYVKLMDNQIILDLKQYQAGK